MAGPVADAFRLGALIESGARPDACLQLVNVQAEREAPAQVVPGYGHAWAVDYDVRDRLVLRPPPRHAFDYPWHLSWPAQVQAQWWATGLSEPPDGVLPMADDHPPEPVRRQAVFDNLVAAASRQLGERYTPRVEVRDRLRVADVGFQDIELDGRRFRIEHRRPFLILQALVNAPSNQLTTPELQDLPGCLEMDVSKELPKLPDGLKGIILSSRGPNSFYYIHLLTVPEVES